LEVASMEVRWPVRERSLCIETNDHDLDGVRAAISRSNARSDAQQRIFPSAMS
jgi:hypothetical protein